MAYARTMAAPRGLALPENKPARPGLWSRLVKAMTEAQVRRAEREIALYLQHGGGKFTDEAEREIERRFLSFPTR